MNWLNFFGNEILPFFWLTVLFEMLKKLWTWNCKNVFWISREIKNYNLQSGKKIVTQTVKKYFLEFNSHYIYWRNRWFHGNFVKKPVTVCKLRNFHTVDMLYIVWKIQKFPLTRLWLNFSESNGFTIEVTKEVIWRNISLLRVNFSFSTLWVDWKILWKQFFHIFKIRLYKEYLGQ